MVVGWWRLGGLLHALVGAAVADGVELGAAVAVGEPVGACAILELVAATPAAQSADVYFFCIAFVSMLIRESFFVLRTTD